MSQASIIFKDWLPDLPDLNNPGLTEALNVIPQNMTFKSFAPLLGGTKAMAYQPQAGYLCRNSGLLYGYGLDTAGGNVGYFMGLDTSWTTKSIAGNSGVMGVDFLEFDSLLIGSVDSQPIYCITVGSSGQFTTLALTGDVPYAGKIGVINRIVVAGFFDNGPSGTTQSYVRWSSIDNPRDWPTPNSTTAIARQAGEQWLDPVFGPCSSIVSGDQFGLVFQRYGINRVTYVGGNVVFQFDNYEAQRGAYFRNATISISGLTYFVSDKGFFVTDGVSVRDIGTDKVTRTFLAEADWLTLTGAAKVRVAADAQKNLIYWSYPTVSATNQRPNRILIYNYVEDRWSRANQDCWAMFTGTDGSTNLTLYPTAFTTGFTLGSFSGTPGTATLITGESELNPGGRAYVDGVKPLIDATASAVTLALGVREDLQAAASYGSAVTANSRTGYCDFRSDSKYHRAKMVVTGTFNAAQGIEFNAIPSGKA